MITDENSAVIRAAYELHHPVKIVRPAGHQLNSIRQIKVVEILRRPVRISDSYGTNTVLKKRFTYQGNLGGHFFQGSLIAFFTFVNVGPMSLARQSLHVRADIDFHYFL